MKNTSYKLTIVLAYADRYLYPILVLLPLIIYRNFLLSGIACFVFALYKLIGYLCKWKHIFCSYQNACHKKMTPNNINWSQVKKSDAYGVPAVFGIIGTLMIIVHYFV